MVSWTGRGRVVVAVYQLVCALGSCVRGGEMCVWQFPGGGAVEVPVCQEVDGLGAGFPGGGAV